jgi:hypothetical protein
LATHISFNPLLLSDLVPQLSDDGSSSEPCVDELRECDFLGFGAIGIALGGWLSDRTGNPVLARKIVKARSLPKDGSNFRSKAFSLAQNSQGRRSVSSLS